MKDCVEVESFTTVITWIDGNHGHLTRAGTDEPKGVGDRKEHCRIKTATEVLDIAVYLGYSDPPKGLRDAATTRISVEQTFIPEESMCLGGSDAREICRELKRPPIGVVVTKGDASSDVVHVTRPWFKITWSVAKSSRVSEQCDINIQSINQI
ncbi:hypothetical protein TNCV_3311621 [Trichonephila clavipes]|nr:hypothetical protein TNCV_3311621 [Trichonephila clavipes]